MAYKAHLNEYRYEPTLDRSPKISLRSDAQCYGRTMAVLGQDLSELADRVIPELHEVATRAYNQKLQKLGKVAA